MTLGNTNRPVRDRLAGDTANALDAEQGTQRRSEPKSNPFGSGWLANEDLGYPAVPRLHWGRVVDPLPMMGAYRVQSETGLIYICSFGGLTGLQPHGARSITTLPIGAGVIFVAFPQSHYGLVLATDPDYITNPLNHRSDYVAQGSRAGIFTDATHDALLTRMRGRGGIPSWTAGRPVDSTSVGEWGAMTETGLGVFLDPFMGYFRVDEETGLFLFYHDQMLRLAGHNLQRRSSHAFKEWLDDQVEGHSYSGETPYHWEALGAYAHAVPVHRTYSAEEVQKNVTQFSILEPAMDDLQSFMRSLRFGGYLGQGWKEMVAAPPNSGTYNRYQDKTNYFGGLSIHAALDGSYAVESAKRVYIAKRVIIPVPKQIKRAEDFRGDNEENYRFASVLGNGQEHKLKEFERGAAVLGPLPLIQATAILDIGAWTFNWQGVHPFHYHRLDWYLPEECDLGKQQIVPDFCLLQSTQFLESPSPFVRHIDHREGQQVVKYFPNESYIALLDDGGIVIGDGYGAEIKMTNGSMFISAPGDVFLQPGKNLNVWAGWDAIIRAYNSADITTTRRDIRLKAENNLQMMGGNNKVGGVLIESKSEHVYYDFNKCGEEAKHTGIILKAANSPVLVITNEFQVDVKKGKPEKPSAGISFKSDCDLRFEAKNILSFIEQSRIDFFPGSANEYWSTATLFGSDLRVNGDLVVDGNGTFNGWVLIVNGHIASTEAAQHKCGLPVFGLKDEDLARAKADLAISDERQYYLEQNKSSIHETPHEQQLKQAIKNAEFSLRVSDDYRTSGFMVFESRWQHMSRLSGLIPAEWKELAVEASCGKTYPHPGREFYESGTAYVEQDLQLYSMVDGASLDRSALQQQYESPQFGPNRGIPLTKYPIIRAC